MWGQSGVLRSRVRVPGGPHLGGEALAHGREAQQLVCEGVRAGAAVAAAGLRARAEQVRERAAGERRQRAKALRRAHRVCSGLRELIC